jgi:hypothetical protein
MEAIAWLSLVITIIGTGIIWQLDNIWACLRGIIHHLGRIADALEKRNDG